MLRAGGAELEGILKTEGSRCVLVGSRVKLDVVVVVIVVVEKIKVDDTVIKGTCNQAGKSTVAQVHVMS